MADTLKVNREYTFNIKGNLANSILFKNTYQGVKLISIMSASEAAKYSDVYTLHKNARENDTTLPSDANECSFLLFKNSSNETLILAEEYIDLTTVALSSKSDLKISIANVEDADVDVILNYIKSLGYVPVKE